MPALASADLATSQPVLSKLLRPIGSNWKLQVAGSAETVVAKQLALPAPSAPAPTGDLTVSPVPAAAASGLVEIKAPMLGTFYRAPKPGADPFVAIGSRIEPDTVIGIIEVMKLMNSVAAGVSGEVVEIVAPDAHLVEYDQVLVRVHPAVERR